MNSLLTWLQKLPLGFDGVFLSLGSFEIQYYGLMYIVAFLFCYFMLMNMLKKGSLEFISKKQLEDLLFGLMLSVVLGGRIGYVLFYDLSYYLSKPLEIVWPFRGAEFVGLSGMSFHGGLLACFLWGIYFVKKNKLNFWKVSDLIISVAPFGYFLGRIGNFLNNELYGRVTESSLGMYFLDDPLVLRHPSQLYQGLVEGLILFLILQVLYKYKANFEGWISSFGLVWLGLMRFSLEFFREPDSHLGLWLGLSRGQYLSMFLMVAGAYLLFLRSKSYASDK